MNFSSQGGSDYDCQNQSFSGCDMVAGIDLTLPNGETIRKVIGQLQTVTYSIFTEKSPVRSIGNINAKDYVTGPRTIAGSLMFAVLNKHWAYELAGEIKQKGGIGSMHFMVDELSPFDITISFQNEYGVRARLAIYGVRVVSEGQTMSINDIYTENTYQYVAADLDYLSDATGSASQNIGAPSGETDAIPDVIIPDERSPIPGGSTSATGGKLADYVVTSSAAGVSVKGGSLW